MKGETSKDGKISGNVQLVRSHDHSSRGVKPSVIGGFKGSGGETGTDHSEIQSVTAQHGPAHTHTIEDNGDGSFTSTTHHASGHSHTARHEKLEHAHEHGSHAMGGDESPDQMTHDDEEAAEEKESPGIHKRIGMGQSSRSGAGGY